MLLSLNEHVQVMQLYLVDNCEEFLVCKCCLIGIAQAELNKKKKKKTSQNSLISRLI